MATYSRALARLLVAAGPAVGCDRTAPTEPDLPDLRAAVPLAVQPAYRLWWSMAEACSGRRGDLAAVTFAVVPGVSALTRVAGQPVAGRWLSDRRTILLAGAYTSNGPVVRHEMLHALLGTEFGENHPYEYFGRRCGGFVTCAGGACGREVAAQTPPAPADARDLATRALGVAVEALPAAFPADSNGGAFAVVVSATNPLAVPVWVGAADGAPPGPEAPGFGFEAGDVQVWGVLPGGRVLLMPGETRRAAFDLTTTSAYAGPLLTPGTYALRGRFGAAVTAPVTLRIDPPRTGASATPKWPVTTGSDSWATPAATREPTLTARRGGAGGRSALLACPGCR